MAGEQLERRLDVDLSVLDAQLKQEQVLWRSIEEGSEQTEKKLQRQRRELTNIESNLRSLGGKIESFSGRGRRLGKSVIQDAVSIGMSEIPGLNSGMVGRGANLVADAAPGGLSAGAITFAALLTAYSEIKRIMQIDRERDKEIEKRMYDLNMKQIATIELIHKEHEARERAELDFASQLSAKMRYETAELIYQSSQFLDQ